MDALRIVHVMRAPVGGLFRHVVDLARAQAERGHAVGIIADASTGGERAAAAFETLAPMLALGVSRLEMSRHVGLGDLQAVSQVRSRVQSLKAKIVHGHGAKGGAYARLAHHGPLRVYTPHGGSLHYSRGSPVGLMYLTLEHFLARRTDLFIFESQYGLNTFNARIGNPGDRARVVHNGVTQAEFEPIEPRADATDLLFVGELRHLKGVDVLLDACALRHAQGQQVTLTIVGGGADEAALRAQASKLGLKSFVRFAGPQSAREAFALGRVFVMPSRAESLPYIILEAAAAGLPIVASDVGGVSEIFGPDAAALIPAGSPTRLAGAIEAALASSPAREALAARLRTRVRQQFSVDQMADAVLTAYAEAQSRRLRQV